MSSAGQQFVANHIPGERIATTVSTTDSATFTTETVVDSVVAPLVTGRTYRVRWTGGWTSTVADGNTQARIREDSVAGTQLVARLSPPMTGAAAGVSQDIEVEFTAASTANKTFVVTGDRTGGATGAHHADGAADRPRYLYVDYIRG